MAARLHDAAVVQLRGQLAATGAAGRARAPRLRSSARGDRDEELDELGRRMWMGKIMQWIGIRTACGRLGRAGPVAGAGPFQERHKYLASSPGAPVTVSRCPVAGGRGHASGLFGCDDSTERPRMDYCYTCRRILNGALTCPGCGAYAPDIDPGPVGPRFEPYVPGYPAGGPAPLPPVNPVAPSRFSAPEPDLDPVPESVLGPASIAPTLHRGRAARRRQMARWKKSRRRAGIATAVALFGGGVTVASMSHSSGRGTTAAAATHDTGSGPLGTDDSSVTTASEQSVPGGNALHTTSTPQHRTTAHTTPAVLPTQDGTDGGGSVPIAVAPASARSQAAPMATTPPQTTATTPPAASGTSGSGTSATGGSGNGGTSTAPASPAPSTPPPATTSPTTPPSQHGLCVLILCIG